MTQEGDGATANPQHPDWNDGVLLELVADLQACLESNEPLVTVWKEEGYYTVSNLARLAVGQRMLDEGWPLNKEFIWQMGDKVVSLMNRADMSD